MVNKKRFKPMHKLTTKDIDQLKIWVDQMYWDFDRMSRSGQDTLDKIATKLGLPTEEDMNQLDVLNSLNDKVYDVIDTMDIDKLKREIIENEKNKS